MTSAPVPKKAKRLKLTAWSLLLVGFLATDGAFADNAAQSTPSATGSTKLQGNVKVNARETEIALKELGDAIKRLRRATQDMCDEVERHVYVPVAEPDVIGPIVLPSIDLGTLVAQGTDALPPRKKYIDLETSEIEQLSTWIQEQENTITFPPQYQGAAQAPWATVNSLTQDILKHVQNLKKVTAAPELKNLDIGREALAIFDDITAINKPWKEVYSELRK